MPSLKCRCQPRRNPKREPRLNRVHWLRDCPNLCREDSEELRLTCSQLQPNSQMLRPVLLQLYQHMVCLMLKSQQPLSSPNQSPRKPIRMWQLQLSRVEPLRPPWRSELLVQYTLLTTQVWNCPWVQNPLQRVQAALQQFLMAILTQV